MTRPQRSEIIELLNRLGAESDEEALAAARALRDAVSEAGWAWDDLLVPDATSSPASGAARPANPPATETAADETVGAAESGGGEIGDESEMVVAASPDEDLRILERLLARTDLSQETHHDLTDFRQDIAAGRLTAMDSRYIRALAKRLGA
jgi:hypothetical protein